MMKITFNVIFVIFFATEKSQIKQHVKIKHFNCDLCDFVATEESYLKDHIHKNHEEIKVEDKSSENKIEKIKEKRDWHDFKKSNWKCGHCDFETDCKEKKCYHKKICPSKKKNFKCTDCGKDSTKKEGLIERMKSVHEKNKVEDKSSENKIGKTKEKRDRHDFKKSNWKCNICDFETNDKKGKYDHKKSTSCPPKKIVEINIAKVIKIETVDKPFVKCPSLNCDYKTTEEEEFAKHIELVHKGNIIVPTVHEGNKQFKCSICDVRFAYKQNLKRHIESVHEGVKLEIEAIKLRKSNSKSINVTCPICDLPFMNKEIMENHIAAVHDRKATYQVIYKKPTPIIAAKPSFKIECDFCDRTFKSDIILEHHMAFKHSDEFQRIPEEKMNDCIKCDDGVFEDISRDKKSKVWEHFSFNRINSEARCVVCESIIKVPDCSTTAMHHHLLKKHSITVPKADSSIKTRQTISEN